MRALIVDYCGVLDGAEEDRRRWRKLLTAARTEGLGTAILSNDPGGDAAAPIRQWQEAGYVDHVILSGEVGAEKPSEEIFTITADRLELNRKDLVLVDDNIVNIRGAVEAGLVGVYYQQFDRAVVEIQGLFGLEGEF
ncbi:HAD-IA family hydrolase [Corynebacterium sp. 320]|uniref:HAD-IA family hydrolase n=1 Tax=Corynebacterium zhongnanshanii TaxID=2768834 RepID=A0ABQ6VFI5_9CORY|nr:MULTISPECIES: HAD-IA family hydrolase [Corynebacterium]KAB1504162.1 HAD-IA family hydrolase [Corynebacterium sp. 320]KAB1552738.1 HAD-IA family hydrolase [Corynebacterium sp. 321]KAB1554044.1 HAD-IA family hydrolase [Corynebacterium sp. 319]KAB3522984.1 HAD-IA family hydrolase [Corynebacterium zhongnanshanii]KAB3528298.1 HAD-IA family hydrolase [Corynebacterium sp. 250]